MDATSLKKESWLRAGAVFAAGVLATFLSPFVAVGGHTFLPSPLTNLLFFFPQIAFPYRGLVVRETDQSRAVFSPDTAVVLNIAQWILLAVLFAWLARRVRFRYLIPLAGGTILVAVIAVQLCFGICGVHVELDGP